MDEFATVCLRLAHQEETEPTGDKDRITGRQRE